MKKVILLLALAVIGTGSVFAQKSKVKEAKKLASATTPKFDEAQSLIGEALVNEETKLDPYTWDVAGLIQSKINDKETEKIYLRQPYDTVVFYNSIIGMFKYYQECDKLAQMPDKKGRIRNKYRKQNSKILLANRGNLINGGIYYFNVGNDEKALPFFAQYVGSAVSSPMFADEDLVKTDTLLPQVAYYAALASSKTKQWDEVIKYAPYAKGDEEVGKYAMEFLSNAFKETADTLQWVETLKEGVSMYPDYQYFFGNLIDYYSNTNNYGAAMKFADDMIAKKPNAFNYYVKGYLYHNEKKFDEAIECYKKTIELDSTYVNAYSNLGLVYCIKAQNFSDKATSDLNSPQYQKDKKTIASFYEMALPYYEKARELKPEEQNLWLQGLYRVYYNLNMGDQFKEIEALM
ncbi:MAG: tetratricopeptide repeat protein [Bacteroidaceae bacterium]